MRVEVAGRDQPVAQGLDARPLGRRSASSPPGGTELQPPRATRSWYFWIAACVASTVAADRIGVDSRATVICGEAS